LVANLSARHEGYTRLIEASGHDRDVQGRTHALIDHGAEVDVVRMGAGGLRDGLGSLMDLGEG
jgi:hypothetical protein